jgi:hypothetical protein
MEETQGALHPRKLFSYLCTEKWTGYAYGYAARIRLFRGLRLPERCHLLWTGIPSLTRQFLMSA